MTYEQKVLKEIEKLREELYSAYNKDFKDEELIKKSQKLDAKLNEYNQVISSTANEPFINDSQVIL